MTTEPVKTSNGCLAGSWLVAAAFGFSFYVVGLVFFDEAAALGFGLAILVALGFILSYIYCYLPRQAAEKEREIEAEAEAARRKAEHDAEPDFDWDEAEEGVEETPDIIDDTVEFDIDVDGPDAALLSEDDVEIEAADDAAGRPVGYDAPDGTPDDLKQIKGIGPKLEILLNEMGFYHIAQIAEWTDEDIAWLDENLEGFKGRATRDAWVPQAQELLAQMTEGEGDDDNA